MWARMLIACALAPLLTTCTTVSNGAPTRDTLFQTSTYAALADGLYDGELTIGELKRHGDFGHGTFNGLDGEMVVLDGVVYQIRPGGAATAAPDETLTPFAAVTPFEPDQKHTLSGAPDYAALQSQLDQLLPDADRPYAIKIAGAFAAIQLRAPHKAERPYPPLTDALATQVIRDYQSIDGTMVGFYFPRHMAGLQFPGYHFHFISADRRTGGHVLAVAPANITIAIDDITHFHLDGL